MSLTPSTDKIFENPKGLLSQWAIEEFQKVEMELRAEINKYKFSVDIYFFQKYAYLVKKNWYGFDLGPLSDDIKNQLDQLLQDIIKDTPDVKILQIKRKFSYLRIYLEGYNKEKFDSRIDKLESISIV